MHHFSIPNLSNALCIHLLSSPTVYSRASNLSETQRRRFVRQRMVVVHAGLLILLLVIVARLLELQVLKGGDYRALAQSQHYGGVVLPAKRGEILSRNSKTGETSLFATNTTLDMVYVDPVVTDDPVLVARRLAEMLVTEDFHDLCTRGSKDCPLELSGYFTDSFDPLAQVRRLESGAILEPMHMIFAVPDHPENTPSIEDVRSSFTSDIQKKISEKRVTFVPLKYGATKEDMSAVDALAIPGVYVVHDTSIIFANPEAVSQNKLSSVARDLSEIVETDEDVLQRLLRSRPLRYVPVMRKLPPDLSLKIKEMKLQSMKDTQSSKQQAETREAAALIRDPLRSIALIPEHWRYYPDGRVASSVVGFLNSQQEAQYGIERTFDAELKGQEGLISSVSDPQGGQILTAEQTIIDPKDGDTIVLTIDRFVQKKIEEIMDQAVIDFHAESGQAIMMDPYTGRIIAMVNAPTFDSNSFGGVYDKEPLYVDEGKRNKIVVEIYHPVTNQFVVKGYIDDIFGNGRTALAVITQQVLDEIEKLYDLRDIARYYLYIGDNDRREVFPTQRDDIWLKFKNNVGVGAYLNRTIQQIYEPGSVFKPITMAIAIDQGEISPEDTYDDKGFIKVDEFTIRNALNATYGKVNMVTCIQFSINTCMTSISEKLGKKLFHRMIERFGFGKITGIELEDELPGEILPWKKWSNSLLANAAFGQGVSATPLQVITAWSALSNGGKLMKPTIIDSIIKSDGTVITTQPRIIDQVITPETSDTITAILVSSVDEGWGKSASIQGYAIAGKTGTSQIAGPGGKYESGTGSGIASFGGFAPVPDPKFLMLVKFDRTATKASEHGAGSAAPVYKKIAEFLFDYYGIPPGREE